LAKAGCKDEADWALQEFAAADLGDARRTARLVQLARDLARNPEASIPHALKTPAAIKAAYRFFDNADIIHSHILQSHVTSSLSRMQGQPLILAAQDTTVIDYAGHPKTEGLGPVHTNGGWGLLCHGTLAFTPERVPLGVLALRTWARKPGERTRERRRDRSIEQKESQKWLDSLRALAELKPKLPDSRLVSVADRESDVYEFFAEAQTLGLDVLARAAWDRNVEQPEGHVWATLAAAPLMGQKTLMLAASAKRASRVARLQVRACPVTIKPPRQRRSEGLVPIALWGVWAYEPHPPKGAEPIEWLLLTTLPVESAEQALQLLDWYAVRWGIEIWHKVLKSGCHIEQRQLGSFEQLQRLLTLYAVIAWRILYAVMLGRLVPDMPCTAILNEDEWQALYCVIHETPKPCATAPPLGQAVRWIAQLGGFIGRASDGQPGVKTLWKGFQYLIGAADMYKVMKPKPRRPRSRSLKNVGND
jgi:hypothetical protein